MPSSDDRRADEARPRPARGRVLQWLSSDPDSWSPNDVRPMRDAVAARINAELLHP